MSKSRLEKFLYALYSLDSSDLPNPLSRIEELYKCLVTGEEAPTFKPLSRVEKYLMAILGVYNVDSLPNPISRVEVLLYKLAIGDDNLDDVKSFLSEHEELLAEIIRNGDVGGNINIEYVLYILSTEFNTLYNTAEKPVKSAILKGNTMKNIIGDEIFMDAGTSSITNITDLRKNYLIPTVKIATNYLVMYELEGDKIEGADASNLVTAIGFLNHNSGWSSNFEQQPLKGKLIINSGNNPNYFRVVLNNKGYSKLKSVKINVIEYEEYMNDFDIPYFEGMKSVQMPVLTTVGKNLWDPNFVVGKRINDNGEVELFIGHACLENYISVLPNKTYSISNSISTNGVKIFRYDNEKRLVGTSWAGKLNFTTESNVKYIRYSGILGGGGNTTEEWMKVFQLEEAPTTAYEPYKTNILTVNEDVVLCRIGDVKDELNCLTGELTQRIGEVVLDGNAGWREYNGNYYVSVPGVQAAGKLPWGKVTILSNLYPSFIGEETDAYIESDWNGNQIKIHDVNLSLEELKSKLMTQPLVATYISNEESVKTVDLSVVDQDGNNTKLKSFDDITYVTLSSEGPIPEAELEVATKNEEVLNTMSLEMDDISTTQTTLEETSNTQSENVDATMIATTEIYEELL